MQSLWSSSNYASSYKARVGFTYQLDAYARHGVASDLVGRQFFAYPFLASATASVPLPPFGTLFLDPSTIVNLAPVAIPQPAGMSTLSFLVPNVPSLVGMSLYAQALIVQQPALARLTNLTADVSVQ